MMRVKNCSGKLRATALVLFALSCVPMNVFAQQILRAGAAKVNITPSEPVPMDGFANRTLPFTGVHDSLYARAVVFESGGVQAAVVSLELCRVDEKVWDELTTRLQQSCGIRKDLILLSATHTHGGPALADAPWWRETDKPSPALVRYTARVKEQIVESVRQAQQQLAPARIGAGTGTAMIGLNRRTRGPDDRITLNPRFNGPCDSSVPVVRVDTEDGRTIALLWNNGTHGTVMGGANLELTGDWCGLGMNYIEETWGGGVIAPFLSGAAGDVAPMYKGQDRFDTNLREAASIGMIAGREVIRVANAVVPRSGGAIEAAQRDVQLPGKVHRGHEPAPDVTLKLSALRVGPVVFAGASGEIFSEIGMAVKDGSPYKHTLFLGNCNGYIGYVPTGREYFRDGYEISVTRIASGGDEACVNTLLELITAFH